MHTPRIKPGVTTDHDSHEHDEDHWSVDEHFRDGYRDEEAKERLEKAGFNVVRIMHGYGMFGEFAWNLLQRIPMSALGKGSIMIPFVGLYLLLVLPIAVVLMILDMVPGDQPMGGSLMVLAQKPED